MLLLYVNIATARCPGAGKDSPSPGSLHKTKDLWIYSQPPLRATILLLLMAACDINPNPGPGSEPFVPCGRCSSAVVKGTRGIQCDGCDKWYHAGCVGISQSEYIKLASSHDDWYCSPDEKEALKKKKAQSEEEISCKSQNENSLSTENEEKPDSLIDTNSKHEGEFLGFEKPIKNEEKVLIEDNIKFDTGQVSLNKMDSEVLKKENVSKDSNEVYGSLSNDTNSKDTMVSIESSSQLNHSNVNSLENNNFKTVILEDRNVPVKRSHDEEIHNNKKLKIEDTKANNQIEQKYNFTIPGKKKRGRPKKNEKKKVEEVKIKRKYKKKLKGDLYSMLSDKEILERNPCPTLKQAKISVHRLTPRSFLNPLLYAKCEISPENLKSICKQLIKMRSNFRRNLSRRKKRLKTGNVLPAKFRADFEDPDDAIRLYDIMKANELVKPKKKYIKKKKDLNGESLINQTQQKIGKPQGPSKIIQKIEKAPVNKYNIIPNAHVIGNSTNDANIRHKLVTHKPAPYSVKYHNSTAIPKYPNSAYPHHFHHPHHHPQQHHHYQQQQQQQHMHRTMPAPRYHVGVSPGNVHYERPIASSVSQQYQTNYTQGSPHYPEAYIVPGRPAAAMGPISPPQKSPHIHQHPSPSHSIHSEQPRRHLGPPPHMHQHSVPSNATPRPPGPGPPSPHIIQHSNFALPIHPKPPPLTPMHNYQRIPVQKPTSHTDPIPGVSAINQGETSLQAVTSQHGNISSYQPFPVSVPSTPSLVSISNAPTSKIVVPSVTVSGSMAHPGTTSETITHETASVSTGSVASTDCMPPRQVLCDVSKSSHENISKSLSTVINPPTSIPTTTSNPPTSTPTNPTPITISSDITSSSTSNITSLQTSPQPASVPVPVIMKNEGQIAAAVNSSKPLIEPVSSIHEPNKDEGITKDNLSSPKSNSEVDCRPSSGASVITQSVQHSITTTTTTTTSGAIPSYKAYGSYQRHLLYPSAKPEIRYYVKSTNPSQPMAAPHQVVTIPGYSSSTNTHYYGQANNNHYSSQNVISHNHSHSHPHQPNLHPSSSAHPSPHQPSSQHVGSLHSSHHSTQQSSLHRQHPSLPSGHYYINKNSDSQVTSRHQTQYASGHNAPGALGNRATYIYPKYGYPESRVSAHNYRSYESQMSTAKPYKASDMINYLEQKVLDGAYANIKKSEQYFALRNQLTKSPRVQEILNEYQKQVEEQKSQSSSSENQIVISDLGKSGSDHGSKLLNDIIKKRFSCDLEKLQNKKENNSESISNKENTTSTLSSEDCSSNQLKDKIEISASSELSSNKDLSKDTLSSKEDQNSKDVPQSINNNEEESTSDHNKSKETSVLKARENCEMEISVSSELSPNKDLSKDTLSKEIENSEDVCQSINNNEKESTSDHNKIKETSILKARENCEMEISVSSELSPNKGDLSKDKLSSKEVENNKDEKKSTSDYNKINKTSILKKSKNCETELNAIPKPTTSSDNEEVTLKGSDVKEKTEEKCSVDASKPSITSTGNSSLEVRKDAVLETETIQKVGDLCKKSDIIIINKCELKSSISQDKQHNSISLPEKDNKVNTNYEGNSPETSVIINNKELKDASNVSIECELKSNNQGVSLHKDSIDTEPSISSPKGIILSVEVDAPVVSVSDTLIPPLSDAKESTNSDKDSTKSCTQSKTCILPTTTGLSTATSVLPVATTSLPTTSTTTASCLPTTAACLPPAMTTACLPTAATAVCLPTTTACLPTTCSCTTSVITTTATINTTLSTTSSGHIENKNQENNPKTSVQASIIVSAIKSEPVAAQTLKPFSLSHSEIFSNITIVSPASSVTSPNLPINVSSFNSLSSSVFPVSSSENISCVNKSPSKESVSAVSTVALCGGSIISQESLTTDQKTLSTPIKQTFSIGRRKEIKVDKTVAIKLKRIRRNHISESFLKANNICIHSGLKIRYELWKYEKAKARSKKRESLGAINQKILNTENTVMDNDQEYLDGLNLVSTENYIVPSKVRINATQQGLLNQLGLELAASAVFTGKVDLKASSKSLQRLYLRKHAQQKHPPSYSQAIRQQSSNTPIPIRPAPAHTSGTSRQYVAHHSGAPPPMQYHKVHSGPTVNPYVAGSGNAYLRETLQQPTGTYRYNSATGQTILYQGKNSTVVRGLGSGSGGSISISSSGSGSGSSSTTGIWHPNSSHHIMYMKSGGASGAPQHNGNPPNSQQSVILQPAGPTIHHPYTMGAQSTSSSQAQPTAIVQKPTQSKATDQSPHENAPIIEPVIQNAPQMDPNVKKQEDINQATEEHKSDKIESTEVDKHSTVSQNSADTKSAVLEVDEQMDSKKPAVDSNVAIPTETSEKGNSEVTSSNTQSTESSTVSVSISGRVMPPPLSYMGGTTDATITRVYSQSTTTPPTEEKSAISNPGISQPVSMAPPTLIRQSPTIQPPISSPSSLTSSPSPSPSSQSSHAQSWSQHPPPHMIGGPPVQNTPMFSHSYGSHNYGGYSYSGHMQGGYMTTGYMQVPPPHHGHMVIHGGTHMPGLIRHQGLPHNHYAYTHQSPHSPGIPGTTQVPLHHGGYIIPVSGHSQSQRGSPYQGMIQPEHAGGQYMGWQQRASSQGTPSPGAASVSSGGTTPGTTPSPGLTTPSPVTAGSPGFMLQGGSLGTEPSVSPRPKSQAHGVTESIGNTNLPKVKQEVLTGDEIPLTLASVNEKIIEEKSEGDRSGDLSVNEFINTLKPSSEKQDSGSLIKYAELKENNRGENLKNVLVDDKYSDRLSRTILKVSNEKETNSITGTNLDREWGNNAMKLEIQKETENKLEIQKNKDSEGKSEEIQLKKINDDKVTIGQLDSNGKAKNDNSTRTGCIQRVVVQFCPASISEGHYESLAVVETILVQLMSDGLQTDEKSTIQATKQLMKARGISRPFCCNDHTQQWYKSFFSHHAQCLPKIQEPQVKIITENILTDWLNVTKAQMAKYQSGSEGRVYYMQEFNFLLDKHTREIKFHRMYSRKFENPNNKDTVSVLLLISACGELGPGLVVFPRLVMPQRLFVSLRSVEKAKHWVLSASESGWIHKDSILEFVTESFVPWLQNKQVQFPVALYSDESISNFSVAGLNEDFVKQGVQLVSVPRSVGAIVSPLELLVGNYLQGYWGSLIWEWRTLNAKAPVTEENFIPFIINCVSAMAIPQKVIEMFNNFGLCPFENQLLSRTIQAKLNRS